MPVVRALKGRSVFVAAGLSSRADLVTFSNYCTANAMQSPAGGGYYQLYEVPNLLAAPTYNAALSCAEFRDSSLMMIPVSTNPTTFPYVGQNLDNYFGGYWPGVTQTMTQFPSLSNDITYFIVYRRAPGLSAYNWRLPPSTAGYRTTGWPALFGAINYTGIPSNTLSFWHDEKSDAEAFGINSQAYYHPGTQLALLSTSVWPPGAPASNSQISTASLLQNSNFIPYNYNLGGVFDNDGKFLIFGFRRSNGNIIWQAYKNDSNIGSAVTSGPYLTGSPDQNNAPVMPFSLNVSPPPGATAEPNRLFGFALGSYSPGGIGMYGLSAVQWSFPIFDFPGLQVTVTHAPTAVGDGRPGANVTLTNARVNQYGVQTTAGSVSFTNIPGGWATPNANFTVQMTSPNSITQQGSPNNFGSLNQNTTYVFQVYDNRTVGGTDYSTFRSQINITVGNNGSTQTTTIAAQNSQATGFGSIAFSEVAGPYNSGKAKWGQDVDRTGGTSPTYGVLCNENSDSWGTRVNNYVGSDNTPGWQRPGGVNILPVLSTNATGFVMVALSSKRMWDLYGSMVAGNNFLYNGAADGLQSRWGVTNPVRYPVLYPSVNLPTINFTNIEQYMMPWGQFLGAGNIPFGDWAALQTSVAAFNVTTNGIIPVLWTMAQPTNVYSWIFLDDPNNNGAEFQRGSRFLQTITDSNNALYWKNTITIRPSGFKSNTSWSVYPFYLEPGHYRVRWTDYRFFRHPLRYLSGGVTGNSQGYEDTYGLGSAGGGYFWSSWPWWPFRDIEIKIERGANIPAYTYTQPAVSGIPVYKAFNWSIPDVNNQQGWPLFSWGVKVPPRNNTGLGGLSEYGANNFKLSLSGVFNTNTFVTFSIPNSTIRIDHQFAPGSRPGFVNSSASTTSIVPFLTTYSAMIYDSSPEIISSTRSRGYMLNVTTTYYTPYAFGWVAPLFNQGLGNFNNLPRAIGDFGPFQTATTRYENYMCNIPLSADIREVMIYNRALTDEQFDANMSYLRGKWNNK